MTNGPAHPDGPGAGGHDDASSYWWLDDQSARASRPSDTRLRLERLKHDVDAAPDLSARILGRAGRHDAFIPSDRRRAIRAFRWGAGLAACAACALTLFMIHRTPVGDAILQDDTPVTDIVEDIAFDAQRVADNVRGFGSGDTIRDQLATIVINERLDDPEETRAVVVFLQDVASTDQTFHVGVPHAVVSGLDHVATSPVVRAAGSSQLGSTDLAEALNAFAHAVARFELQSASQQGLDFPTFRTGVPSTGGHQTVRAGFFATDPQPR